MYHERTYQDISRSRRTVLIAIVAVLLVCAALFAFGRYSQHVTREQAVTSIRESVLDAAVQCCAVEGSYPSELAHLERSYGLVINHDDYVVLYEWLGDNIAPSVVVRQR